MIDQILVALELLPLATLDTLYMVGVSFLLACLLGLPIGVILFLTGPNGLKESPLFYKILGTIVNIGRSFPFAILLIALIPFTRAIVGTSLGTTASIVPLTVAAIPYLARLVETSMQGVRRDLIETSVVMGASTLEIVRKVLIPESVLSLISNAAIALINLVGYSAMAGLVGGGGLGTVAIQYGYQRFNTPLMIITVILLILLVQAIQWIGNLLVKKIGQKRGVA